MLRTPLLVLLQNALRLCLPVRRTQTGAGKMELVHKEGAEAPSLASKNARVRLTERPALLARGSGESAFLLFLLFLPSVALAQTFKGFVDVILDINQLLVLLIFAITFLVLAWTVVKTWIIGGGDESEVEKGKRVVTVGIVVLVIMSGLWGILAILRSGLFGFF